MTRFAKNTITAAAILLIAMMGNVALAQTNTVTYQGVLRGADGLAVEDGSYPLTVTIYDDASGGSALWSESHSVQTTSGAFSVLLGSSTSLGTLFTDHPGGGLWLEISADVGGGTQTYSPRVQLTRTPYAFHAIGADSVAWDDITGKPAEFGDSADELNSSVAYDSGTNTLTVTDAGGALDAVIDISDDISAHAGNASAHHARYEDSEAVAAVLAADGSGSGLDADTLDGVQLTDIQSEIDGDLTTHTEDASAHHARYEDAEAVAAVLAADGSGSGLDADTVDGADLSTIQSEIDSDVAAHAINPSAHHSRYADGEAVAAVLAADGSGSGLDADTLDGQDATAFASASHNHAASEITSGTMDIDRLPTGTGASEVAVGNHTHSDLVMPAGVIVPFAGTTAPSGWLLCDGSAVSRMTYADLFNATGAGSTWGDGDGSTTFNLPDLRGAFLRGSGATGTGHTMSNGTPYDGGSVGAVSDDRFQGHKHLTVAGINEANPDPVWCVNGYGGTAIARNDGPLGTISNPIGGKYTGSSDKDSGFGGPRESTETAPYNVSVNYIIKY